MRHGVGLLWLSILRHLPCACAGEREGEPSEWLRDEPLGRLLEARARQREADGGHAGRVAAWGALSLQLRRSDGDPRGS